ncbi:MAG: DNA repair protein RadC [Puniceicoccales bacterium]|jgi:DNA repair protein RadC|nr:DNA repair protein RadC [Puniceicoccales bacterium]
MKNSNGHRQNLRERFLKAGFDCFAEHEILELLLTLCIPRKDVKTQAKELLQRFGSLSEVLDADIEKLQEIKGIGKTTAIALHIIRNAAALYLQKSAENTRVKFDTTSKLENFWQIRIGHLNHEVFEVAYLDKQLRLLRNGIERIEEGIIDRANVFPRKIIEHSIRKGACGIVLAHNHPSGSERPSVSDERITKSIVYICNSLCIRVLDHIIVARNSVFSFRRANLL